MSEYVLKQYQGNTEEAKAKRACKPGMILYGYCCGYFGRDSYGDKKIIEIFGNKMEVEEDGVRYYADIESWKDLIESSNQELEKKEKYENE